MNFFRPWLPRLLAAIILLAVVFAALRSPRSEPLPTTAGRASPVAAVPPPPLSHGVHALQVPLRTPTVAPHVSVRELQLADLEAGSALHRQVAALEPAARSNALRRLSRLMATATDPESLRVDPRGGVYFVCRALPVEGRENRRERAQSIGAAVPIANVPVRHSLPGATKVLFLDFNGHVVTGTAWNTAQATSWNCLPYDTDGDRTTFSDTEQSAILEIWRRVAEDYAPFDVDVTTEEPAQLTPQVARALITLTVDAQGQPLPENTGGGVAYADVFGDPEFATRYSPAFIYADNLAGGAAAPIAEAASHELGHLFGLSHDGTATAPYYDGHGSGALSWGAIMGAAYHRNVSQWSRGEYFGANNTEDDLTIIASHLGYRPDDAGAGVSDARALAIGPTGEFSHAAVIAHPGDADVFAFATAAGSITLQATPYSESSDTAGTNLDAALDILDGTGAVVASSNPTDGTSASVTFTAATGMYYARITGVGAGTPLANPPIGYTAYGSLGSFTFSGLVNVAAPGIAAQPQSEVLGTGEVAVLSVNATGGPLSYQWLRDGNPIAGATDSRLRVDATQPGSYRVAVTNPAGTVLSNPAVITTVAETVTALALQTVAGTAPGHADATGGNARFHEPRSVALGSDGTLYVADAQNHVVRKVTSTGIVTTLAGMPGERGFVDGTAMNARFHTPADLAVDAQGNVYVSDSGNQAIRMVSPSGVTTTIPIPQSEFVSGFGIAVDGEGSLYVADSYYCTVVKRTSAGVVTTLAGQKTNRGFADGPGNEAIFNFSNAGQIGWDGNGGLLVADSANGRIRRIGMDGTVSTVVANLTFPTGVCSDGHGGLYVADTFVDKVIHIAADGARTAFGGPAAGSVDGTATAARFNQPGGLAADAAGNCYVADVKNSTVRKITGAGSVSTLAGRPVSGFDNGPSPGAQFGDPLGVAVDAAGAVYVADRTNNSIRRLDGGLVLSTYAGIPDGLVGHANGPGAEARFYWPFNVTADANGNIFVAEPQMNLVRRIATGGIVTTLAGFAAEIPTIVGGLAPGGSADGAGQDARFYGPFAVACDRHGNVFVADSGNHTIRRITPQGVVSTLAGSALEIGSADGVGAAARFKSPSAIAVSDTGDVYVADGYALVRRISPDGRVVTVAGSPSANGLVDGVGADARFSAPYGLAIDARGVVYVSDTANHAIRAISPNGAVTTVAGDAYAPGLRDGVGGAARLREPYGIAVGGDGQLWIADRGNGVIRRAERITVSRIIDQMANAGGSATFTVVSPYPGTTYQWLRNGVAIPGQTSSSITLSPLTEGMAGSYQVRVNTPRGEILTNPATLTVRMPPTIVSGLGAMAATEGNQVMMSVQATGAPPLSYEWTCNGVPIAGASGPELVRANLERQDAGTYAVIVRNPAGSATSMGQLDVTAAPTGLRFVRQPASQVVTQGAGFALSVAASDPSAVYQWLLNGLPIPGADGSIYTVPEAGITGSFDYRVQVTNEHGSNLSDVARVTILRRPSYIFATLAGGTLGYADGRGAQARFRYPSSVAPDGIGNVYVADENSIRKVSADGEVTTLAGGSVGPADGLGKAAQFNSPAGVLLHGTVLYVSDTYNSLLRKVTLDGMVTTWAGLHPEMGLTDGVGAAARFRMPSAIAFATDGSAFVADAENHSIRRITPAGEVATVAGSTSLGAANGPYAEARFNRPTGIVRLPSGDFVVSEFGNHQLRVLRTNGTVATLAGSAGVVGDADGSGAEARFFYPSGLALDSQSNVLVADYGNNRIRRVTAAGVVTTLAGRYQRHTDGTDDVAEFRSPRGVAMDPTGNVYVADTYNHAVRVGRPVRPVTLATAPTNLGGTITLSTGPSIPGAAYEWWHDGQRIAGAAGPTLAIGSVTAADAGLYSVTVTHADWTQTSVVVAHIILPPVITAEPVDQDVWRGGAASFAVNATGEGLSYQWQKGGENIPDATGAVYTVASATPAEVGSYRCVVANSAGEVVSANASLTVKPIATATHTVSGARISDDPAWREVTVQSRVTWVAPLTGIAWQVAIPEGWVLAAETASTASTRPAPAQGSLLEWSWTSSPPSPLEFSYTLRTSAANSTAGALSALVSANVTGVNGTPSELVTPDPLSLPPPSHSADTNGDFRLSLSELTRVIELYNTRNGTVRTGAYAVATVASEDGFAPAPGRNLNEAVSLSRYHSADTPGSDGQISLLELTRVIELYNFRSGTARTGQYHVESGTADGFAVGP